MVVPPQAVKVGVDGERILPVGLDEVGVPVEALGPALRHADHAPVALAVAHVAVSWSCSAGGARERRWMEKENLEWRLVLGITRLLPTSQNFPLYPFRQVQLKRRLPLTQAPPFWQGLGWQGDAGTEADRKFSVRTHSMQKKYVLFTLC